MKFFSAIIIVFLITLSISVNHPSANTNARNENSEYQMQDAIKKLEKEFLAKYGEAEHSRISQGLRQAASFWRPVDGDAAVFEEFARNNFAGDQATLDPVFERFERLLEQIDGHMHEINRELRNQSDLEIGAVY